MCVLKAFANYTVCPSSPSVTKLFFFFLEQINSVFWLSFQWFILLYDYVFRNTMFTFHKYKFVCICDCDFPTVKSTTDLFSFPIHPTSYLHYCILWMGVWWSLILISSSHMAMVHPRQVTGSSPDRQTDRQTIHSHPQSHLIIHSERKPVHTRGVRQNSSQKELLSDLGSNRGLSCYEVTWGTVLPCLYSVTECTKYQEEKDKLVHVVH